MSKPTAIPVDPYRAEDDARTLQRAGEVKSDPMRHKAAMGHMAKQVDLMQSVMKTEPAMPTPATNRSNRLGFAKGKK